MSSLIYFFLHESLHYGFPRYIYYQSKHRKWCIWKAFSFMKWCNIFFQVTFLEKPAWLKMQLKGLFLLWMATLCLFKSLFFTKQPSQFLHWNDFILHELNPHVPLTILFVKNSHHKGCIWKTFFLHELMHNEFLSFLFVKN